ncbi:MAG: tRNA (adenosine(37)-N6)-threonylcarbamoyltransferase complex ATPase subunit type 1 TsaE [Gammaproteobacteria bacterium]|nr:tRNA (adenosine(37)-N6)-threonylcarbamoyltransferase complex ATPase subunit type 1 TsaE [Gammaproteobacteria bacterium]
MVIKTVSTQSLILKSEHATREFGVKLSRSIDSGVVYLEGLLGAGKTTVVKGWLQDLGYGGTVRSPTYTIVEPYELDGKSILHIDLYRINDPVELEFIGLVEQIAMSELVFVEWPAHGEGVIPTPDYKIKLEFVHGGRLATCDQ